MKYLFVKLSFLLKLHFKQIFYIQYSTFNFEMDIKKAKSNKDNEITVTDIYNVCIFLF